jgi:uncharacterized protein (TIGR00299 family) protein
MTAFRRALHIDVIGGAAGDMLLAALLDAGAPQDRVFAAIEAVVPGRFAVATETVRRGGIRALWLRVEPGPAAGPPAHISDELVPRPLAELLEALDRAALDDAVRTMARAVLERLGDAEARVHAVEPGGIDLHELGDDDTLLDVVGIAAAIHALNVGPITVSPVPLGAGHLEGRHAHGPVPLPAPVTLELLRGFAVSDGGVGETVTPTAAAVFAALGSPVGGIPAMTLDATGYGAGTRDPADRPNVVRVLLGAGSDAIDEESDDLIGRDLLVLEANLDDLTPELVADAAGALGAAGALDVWTTSVNMKKGRLGVTLSALCEPEGEARLTRTFFEATSTFGLRILPVRRAELRRRMVSVPMPEGSVRVKVGLLGSRVITAKPEHDDVAALARLSGRPVRQVHEEATAVARALVLEQVDG